MSGLSVITRGMLTGTSYSSIIEVVEEILVRVTTDEIVIDVKLDDIAVEINVDEPNVEIFF